MSNFRVEQVSGISLPSSSELVRTLTDGLIERNGNVHVPRYDYRTIFYDAVVAQEGLKLFGPPARNLREWIARAEVRVDGRLARLKVTSGRRWHISTVFTLGTAEEVLVRFPGGFAASMRVSPVDSLTFRDRRVLMVMSKDNALEWIADWASFYSRAHGIDGVVLYDNDSSAYSPDDVLDRLKSVPGIAAAVVVPWRYPFGPHGTIPGAQGSNYSQVNSYRHARHRFLSTAAGAINADIDELIVSKNGRSAFDLVAEGPSPALLADGHWIEAWPRVSELPRVRDFSFYNPKRRPPRPKWVADLRRLPPNVTMAEHKIVSDGEHLAVPSSELELLHYRGLTTGWKQDRTAEKIDEGKLVPHELARAVHRILRND